MRDLRLVGFDDGSERALEAIILNAREVLAQDCGSGFVRPEDGGAKLLAGPAKEAEIRLAGLLQTKPVDFVGDSHDCQSVGVVQCHGKPQNRQLPGAERLGVPLLALKHLQSSGLPLRPGGRILVKPRVRCGFRPDRRYPRRRSLRSRWPPRLSPNRPIPQGAGGWRTTYGRAGTRHISRRPGFP